ncbi:hypothetical protein [Micromonospora halophytica]|uniref:Kynureninase n=1 Tax=Micromonospora halophytica TaxID=47864 RepID=A0A1C5I8Y0_9ACTN|nr:hypothetical protein [Micromonospora halophytica]SCG54830.1 hypothetical protein GA0070560_10957 [Micromonospora halophytica]
MLAEAGIDRVREKGRRLGELIVALADAWLTPYGFTVATPRDPARRGSHVSLHHPEALRISRALAEQGRVVGDHRAPDRLRLGPAPLYTRYVDVGTRWTGCGTSPSGGRGGGCRARRPGSPEPGPPGCDGVWRGRIPVAPTGLRCRRVVDEPGHHPRTRIPSRGAGPCPVGARGGGRAADSGPLDSRVTMTV